MTTRANHPDAPVSVVVHLSGRYRGKIERLAGDRLTIDTKPGASVRFSGDDLTPGLASFPDPGPYAVLERRGDAYEIVPALEADVWINGRRTERRLLESGDVLEIGEGGPVLRYRQYPPGSRAYKSVSEVFSDCAECVRHGRSAVDRAGLALIGPPMELLTRTTPLVRLVSFAVIVALAVAVTLLWSRSERLEGRLEAETRTIRGLGDLLERRDLASLTTEDLEPLRRKLSDSVSRIDALEARSEARVRVISGSAPSVAFVQGSWGLERRDGRPLRFVVDGPGGEPVSGPDGPLITFDGDGPPVELFYTGTAFVVSPDGYLLTNRHVALPWDYDESTEIFVAEGLEPVIRRFVGYLPGRTEPFDLELVRASDTLDVALLHGERFEEQVTPLRLSESPPRRGDEVIVLGYPTGMQALLARADPAAVQALIDEGALDFWQVARRLSEAGLIEPLATVGVVGQVTGTSVVYDAETTHGGSGGPVLDLEGWVLAVNTAVLPQFGGSNLGVPAAEALRLLQRPEQPQD